MKAVLTGREDYLSVDDLRRVAHILATMERLRRDLFTIMNCRVQSKWTRSQCSPGRYLDQLRGALNDDWYQFSNDPSPFYGAEWDKIARQSDPESRNE